MNWDAKCGMNREYRMEMHANEGQMNEDRDGGLWLCVDVDVDAATMRSDRGRAREADVRRTDRQAEAECASECEDRSLSERRRGQHDRADEHRLHTPRTV